MDRQLWWGYLLKYGQNNILFTDEIFTNFRLHLNSKSVGEGGLFENEFDRLKLSLFQQLNAPSILENQVCSNLNPFNIHWEIGIRPVNYIIAEFATWYAERNYIKDEMLAVKQLMKHVKKWKCLNMNIKEWKLWGISTIFSFELEKTAK